MFLELMHPSEDRNKPRGNFPMSYAIISLWLSNRNSCIVRSRAICFFAGLKTVKCNSRHFGNFVLGWFMPYFQHVLMGKTWSGALLLWFFFSILGNFHIFCCWECLSGICKTAIRVQIRGLATNFGRNRFWFVLHPKRWQFKYSLLRLYRNFIHITFVIQHWKDTWAKEVCTKPFNRNIICNTWQENLSPLRRDFLKCSWSNPSAKQRGPLQLLPGTFPLEFVAIGIWEPLQKTQSGYQSLLIIHNRYK